MSFLLDTNIVSEIRRKKPNAGVAAWFESVRPSELFLSALVVGEIRQGIERLVSRAPGRAEVLEKWLGQLVTTYSDRVVPVTVEVAEVWGRLNAKGPLPVVDGLLAATALAHGWTLVTRNVRDIAPTGVRYLDPFLSR
ncbi:type II toxin-antitoxin system VapC family toxin [Actinophytocola sp.]|uniref:type II toxin-antitoxin system VapC family toxin n=1 Tax=Actinophytocola sp. TaxID=1872138 RepID=UPI002ED45896